MGLVPQPASEVRAWAQGCGHKLQPWEFAALLAASRAYVDEHHAENPVPPDRQVVRLAVAKKFKQVVAKVKAPC